MIFALFKNFIETENWWICHIWHLLTNYFNKIPCKILLLASIIPFTSWTGSMLFLNEGYKELQEYSHTSMRINEKVISVINSALYNGILYGQEWQHKMGTFGLNTEIFNLHQRWYLFYIVSKTKIPQIWINHRYFFWILHKIHFFTHKMLNPSSYMQLLTLIFFLLWKLVSMQGYHTKHVPSHSTIIF